jgi:hypothetical protein
MKQVSQGSGLRRFMVVGCSHGIYADPKAVKAVLDFKKWFKPHTVGHLGDFTDMSAHMGGSSGEGDAIKPDLDGGLDFLKELGVNFVMEGNHEVRLRRDLRSSNQLRVRAAETSLEAIEATCLKLHALYVPYTGVWQVYKIANYTFTHGTIYNENSARDMAEMYGNVIFAHTHKPMQQIGRRIDSPVGMSVGTLTRRGAMDYANTRRSTLGWGQGFVYGEYNDNALYPSLHIHDNGEQWHLPKNLKHRSS